MKNEDSHIGRNVRRLRLLRDMSQEATAGLAGISAGYLSLIESGNRAVSKRATLEALANALRVSPFELTEKPWERTLTQDEERTQAQLVPIISALDICELGNDPGERAREWHEVKADVARSIDLMHVHADYATQAELVPNLLKELHALYVRDPGHRREILLGLTNTYKSAVALTKYLGGGGVNGLSLLAAKAGQQCAEELDVPQWRAIMSFYRGFAMGSANRLQQYQRAVQMAEEISPSLNDREVTQAYGTLHLSAALAAATQSDRDTAATHLDEATAVASRLDTEVGTFSKMWFGETNIGIWRVAVSVELGDTGNVAEIARNVHVESIPSPGRQAAFYSDVGRALIDEKRTRETGAELLLKAEQLAPQRVRNNAFVRDVVTGQLRHAKRGTKLRALALALGLTPKG
ncbi:helix-turn-helix domain-containing protein [Actinocrispum wychmicini]|uniref:Transcriptional regulator with XRE-family HTH domain n=1 Tax=Actinocrispum wychmicini TaxID=1213861 RepID=A0A4R2J548_9PSEU|nr:helix-turn-helix domain-containing protein [Actinocrispum wychmicini]TCO52977.1 transcriptional regulator with XRE-family HTH domain [Actinocrispum wychmicini]